MPWATKNGALQTFGVEAAVVVGLFILIVPLLQIKGRYLRVSICLSGLDGSSDVNYAHRNVILRNDCACIWNVIHDYGWIVMIFFLLLI